MKILWETGKGVANQELVPGSREARIATTSNRVKKRIN